MKVAELARYVTPSKTADAWLVQSRGNEEQIKKESFDGSSLISVKVTNVSNE